MELLQAIYQLCGLDATRQFAFRRSRATSTSLRDRAMSASDRPVTNTTRLLLRAGLRNDTETLETLLAAGVDVDATDEDGRTALRIACRLQKPALVARLLTAGASVHQRNPTTTSGYNYSRDYGSRGSTPLIFAIEFGCWATIELLLDAGAEVDAIDSDGASAMMRAAAYGHTELVERLVANGANVRRVRRTRNTALHDAMHKKYQRGLDTLSLLVAAGADLEQMNQTFRHTTLGSAVAADNAPAVARLVADGADVNGGLEPPLIAASRYGFDESVAMLLAAGADVQCRGREGETPLLVAAERGHTTVVRLLLDAFADIDAENPRGETALLCAEQRGHADTVELLVAYANGHWPVQPPERCDVQSRQRDDAASPSSHHKRQKA